jgi:hypothetical protein
MPYPSEVSRRVGRMYRLEPSPVGTRGASGRGQRGTGGDEIGDQALSRRMVDMGEDHEEEERKAAAEE